MKRQYSIYIISILVFLLSCEKPGKGLDQLFPGAGFEKGWSWHGMPTHYNPENLYEYINGEAELYLSYGFQELATVTYFWGNPDDSSFIVDIYNMGDALHAFGLYSNDRFSDYQYEGIGTEAIVSEYGIKFFQGRYFVDIKSSSDSDKFNRAMHTIAKKVMERIEEPADFPEILTLLPSEGKIDKTERYKANEMLNQDFLPGGLEARYRILNEEGRGFIILFENEQSAQQGNEKLSAFYREDGKIFSIQSISNVTGFGVRTDYRGLLFISSLGRYIFGVQDFTSTQKGLELLVRIHKELVKAG